MIGWAVALLLGLLFARQVRLTAGWQRRADYLYSVAEHNLRAARTAEEQAMSAADLKGVYVVPPDVIGEHTGDLRA